ncbi:MAG TPA: class I SAM-dependent methyltransferase [Anaeromyxobacteraceae bacterium]
MSRPREDAAVRVTTIDQGGAPAADVRAGAAVYARPVLAIYDAFVLGVSNAFVWRCPTRELLAHYDAHVSASHLDVGVGSGYYLDRCRFPSAAPRLALADLNENSLHATAHRVRRYRPRAYRLDVLSPFDLPEAPFASIGLCYLLHCVPGSFPAKGIAFDHLRPLLAQGGVLFGATLLGAGVERSWLARGTAALYNRARIFSNDRDSLAGLEAALSSRFSRIELRTVGSVALFSARAA